MTTIKFRRDTSVNWTSVNPIPAQGEPCYETDTGKLKIGNGSDNYVALPYVSDGGGSSGDLPIATATTLGGIKVGNNLSITEDGTLSANGGSTGTTDYTQLENKPRINSVELTGNKTLDDLGIQAKGNYLTALPDNAVTTDTTQEITGDKTFTKTITTNNITCNNTLMASTIRTKANGTIKLAHPMNNASGMITLDNNYGQLSITNGLSSNNNLLQVVSGTAYATLMGNKIETKDKDGNLYYYINSKNIANCLLEVPQRMKLELNDGTLTLKAGSQVIVPNGFEAGGTTPKFDYVTVQSDYNYDGSTALENDQLMLVYSTELESTSSSRVTTCYSGDTAPQTTQSGAFWYDTANNVVKKWENSQWNTGGYSLSIAVATNGTGTGGSFTSLDQVFNGMGYIGSTAWVDKGVKGLIPNGKNADGSLRNIEVTTKYVSTLKVAPDTSTLNLMLNKTGIFGWWEKAAFIQEDTPDFPTTISNYSSGYWYKPSENNLYYHAANSTSGWVPYSTFSDVPPMIVGVIQRQNVKDSSITSFNLELPFRAVDYNDKSEISGWSMPSNRYIDLTIGDTGSTYTVPANGYVHVLGTAHAANARIELVTSKLSTSCISPTKSSPLASFIPVMNGDVVNIRYANVGIGLFRFVYAEGSK